MLCLICDNTSPYYCIGACNHPICSNCAIRMRFKNNDKKCSICKQTNDLMIVAREQGSRRHMKKSTSKTSNSQQTTDVDTYSGIKRYEDFELFGDSAAGGILLEEASVLFIDCSAHCKELRETISFHCPHTDCAKNKPRFPSLDSLIKHLKSKHDKTVCRLCVEHKALFISEHPLLSASELSQHLASASSSSSSSEALLHPMCQFCNTHLFDAADLFNHMRTIHFSCRHCPADLQHRYYRSVDSLEAHIRDHHLTCPHANCSMNHIAFSSALEYGEHMQSFHGRGRMMDIPINFGASQSLPPYSNLPVYLDLYAASPDPNVPNPGARSTTIQRNTAYSNIAPAVSIPPNMRIAGKVKNGIFHRDGSDEEFEKTLSAQYSSNNQDKKQKLKSARSQEDFPSLSLAASTSVPADVLHTPHPMSFMTKERRMKAAETERLKLMAKQEEETRRQADDDRRRLRNDAVAQALGLSSRSALDGGFIGLFGSSVTAASLDLPLYTSELLAWGKNNMIEVLRLEKRLHLFLNDRSAASVSLKPMVAFHRDLVHDIATYYQLNSHEYDPEPKRYVSLVKTMDSVAPSLLLSVATKSPLFVITDNLHTQNTPSVYLTMKYTSAGMTLSLLAKKLANDLSHLSKLSEDPPITAIKPIGPNGVIIDFTSFKLATEAYIAMIEVRRLSLSSKQGKVGATFQSVIMNSTFLDLFEIEPAFIADYYIANHHIHHLEPPRSELFTREEVSLAPGNAVAVDDAWDDDGTTVIDSKFVVNVDAKDDYLDWQFRVGGHVSVAYAVAQNAQVNGEDMELNSWEDERDVPSEDTRDREIVNAESSMSTSQLFPSNSTTELEDYTVPLEARSEYKHLVLQPRTLPAALKPWPVKQQERVPQNSKKSKKKQHLFLEEDVKAASNVYLTLVEDSSDDEEKDHMPEAPIRKNYSATDSNGWACSLCTFVNEYIFDSPRICNVCEHVNE